VKKKSALTSEIEYADIPPDIRERGRGSPGTQQKATAVVQSTTAQSDLTRSKKICHGQRKNVPRGSNRGLLRLHSPLQPVTKLLLGGRAYNLSDVVPRTSENEQVQYVDVLVSWELRILWIVWKRISLLIRSRTSLV
jgi:hypothetical protein